MGRGVFSQNEPTGRSWSRARTRTHRRGRRSKMCAGTGCAWAGGCLEPVSACPRSLVSCSSGFSPQGVSGCELGPAGPTGQREEAIAPCCEK